MYDTALQEARTMDNDMLKYIILFSSDKTLKAAAKEVLAERAEYNIIK
jgi:hypothetical protein